MLSKVPSQFPGSERAHTVDPIVSLKDIFDKLQTVSNDVSDVRSDTRVMREQLGTVTDRTIDHETRIREVERITTEVSDHPRRLPLVEAICSSVSDHPDRLRSIEKKVWAIPSAATLIALVALTVTIWKAFYNG
jgi:hypothetical protein